MRDKRKTRNIYGFIILATFFVISVYLSLSMGSKVFSVSDIWAAVTSKNNLSVVEYNILYKIRIPRMLAGVLFGAALSLSGYLLQVFFRNPIAGPYVLGISSGARLFVGFVILTNSTIFQYSNSLWINFIASTLGSILVMLCVLIFSTNIDNISVLLIIGIMFGYIASAITNLLIAFASENKIAGLTNWSLGSLSGISKGMIHVSLIIIIPCIIITYILSKPLEIYQFGENYAKTMGVNIKAFRVFLVLSSSILCAVVTAFAGPISFVGIAVPHITRQLFKSANPKILIPAVCLMGAVFTTFCDVIARISFSPIELSLSTVTSILGAPIVIYLLMGRKRN